MLVITRRSGESFFIGDDIEVVILEGGPVRIGIQAPAHIDIVRTELIPAEDIEDVEELSPLK